MLHKKKILKSAATNPNLTSVKTKSILDTIAVTILSMVMIFGNAANIVVNKMSPEELNDTLLGHFLIYCLQFFYAEFFIWNLIAICYLRRPELRKGMILK
jgi:hypothetical protein